LLTQGPENLEESTIFDGRGKTSIHIIVQSVA